MQQRWTDKEVVERVIDNIKAHWQDIKRTLNKEPDWKDTWNDFDMNWLFWNDKISNLHYHIVQLQNILDIKNEELEEILKEKEIKNV